MKTATSEEKLKELIVYISAKCSDDSNYGATKLNKILFYSDFLYYLNKKKSISNYDYVHLQRGPVPDNIDIMLDEMKGKDIAIAFTQAGPYRQKKIVALREANLSLFDADMISFVDTIIDQVCNRNSLTATQLSDSTHETMGWIVTNMCEKIPYESIFLKNRKYQVPNAWEKKKAKEIIKQLAGNYGFPKTSYS